MNGYVKIFRRYNSFLGLLVAFLAGVIFTGIFSCRQGPRIFGEIDNRYPAEHGRAAKTIGRLATELEHERELNRELREHNHQAREIAVGLADSVERNVGNLQEAVGLIGEIRKKLKVLEDFYVDRDPGYSRAVWRSSMGHH
ncbi:MAG: hypothetical protein FWH38_06895 [Treponema sp.]|nr:hypothetical protein [Treponema sp.]